MNNDLINILSSLESYNGDNIILVGDTALAYNHLIYDYTPISVWTNYKGLDRTMGEEVMYQHYHLHDNSYTNNIVGNIYLPTSEKAILDTIIWLPENMNEGSLIEALQTYQEHHDKSGLYECADHYGVPHEFIDYWWKEAEEETDMSMG